MLFKKNKKTKEEKNLKNDSLLTSFDRMVYVVVKQCSDDEMFEISDHIISGKPVLANFDNVDIASANTLLSFVSGVVYALKGEITKINPRLFLFGRKEAYEDDSLRKFLEENK